MYASSSSSSSIEATPSPPSNKKRKPAPLAAAAAAAAPGGWEGLSHDVLVTIFGLVDAVDKIARIPFVCKSWRRAAGDPECWRILDFRAWDLEYPPLKCPFSRLIDFSIGHCQDLVQAVYFPDYAPLDTFHLVAYSCPNLLYISIPETALHHEEICEVITKFKYLKGMALHESLVRFLSDIPIFCTDFTELRVYVRHLGKHIPDMVREYLPCVRKLEIVPAPPYVSKEDEGALAS